MCRKHLLLFILTYCITFLLPKIVHAQTATSPAVQEKIYRIDILEEIDPGIARQVSKAMKEAEKVHADRILIRLNTYGGLLDAADSIRTLFLNSKIPTIVFIDNNAASAGALISIACEKIYMRQGGSIGAATVVNDKAEALPDKYQSYMRSMMRATAEARKRDPQIAEAMVDPRILIPGVIDSGKVLTLTTDEALKYGYCNGVATTVQEVLAQEAIASYQLITYEPTWIDKIISFLIHPALSGILILIMLGGIYYELQQPGIGFPILAAMIAALLYFAPLYLEGLAANWEILMSVIGIILIVLEIFVIPGFGVVGISGGILLLIGLTVSLLHNNGLDFSPVSNVNLFSALATVLMSMVGALLMFIAGSKVFASSPAFQKMVLQESMSASSGYVSGDVPGVTIGMEGVANTFLRPSGKVKIGDIVYAATCESGYIDAGTKVVVIGVLTSQLLVKTVA